MINYRNDDITKVNSGIVAHGVNCRGVMNSGVAAAIRKKWPEAYIKYRELYESVVTSYPSSSASSSLLGTCHVILIRQPILPIDGLWVANCFTQENYGSDGKRYADLNAIRSCLQYLFSFAKVYETEIHTVRIGCGLGGRDWDTEVKPIFEELYNSYQVPITIYHK